MYKYIYVFINVHNSKKGTREQRGDNGLIYFIFILNKLLIFCLCSTPLGSPLSSYEISKLFYFPCK